MAAADGEEPEAEGMPGGCDGAALAEEEAEIEGARFGEYVCLKTGQLCESSSCPRPGSGIAGSGHGLAEICY
jgi:hypothetical protein